MAQNLQLKEEEKHGGAEANVQKCKVLVALIGPLPPGCWRQLTLSRQVIAVSAHINWPIYLPSSGLLTCSPQWRCCLYSRLCGVAAH